MRCYRSARELLNAVVLRYRSMPSYADTGFVQDLRRGAPSTSFETAFRRPDDFSFRFSSPHPYRPLRHIVSYSRVGLLGGSPYFLTEDDGHPSELEYPESLQMAIAGATGISRGSAFLTWSLLFEDGHDLFSTLARPRFREYSTVDGVRCHRVTAIHRYLNDVEIHIGVADLLLRRWVTNPDRHTSVQTRRNINLGGEFNEETFNVASRAPANDKR